MGTLIVVGLLCGALAVEAAAPVAPVLAAEPALGLEPLTPARLLDTRPDGQTVDGVSQAIGLTPAAQPLELHVAGRGGVPATGVGAVVINVTIDNTSTAGRGFVTVYPSGVALPTASSLNYEPGAVVANELVAKVGDNGSVSIFTQTSTHVIVDVVGWFPTTTQSVFSLTPARLLDTRADGTTIDGQHAQTGATPADGTIQLPVTGRGGVQPNASAVVINVTVVNEAPGTGFLTVFPTDAPRPLASSLNYVPGQIVANELIAKVGANGSISIYTQTATHVVVDVVGYFFDTGAFGLTPITPQRVMDTRLDGTTIDDIAEGTGQTVAGVPTELRVTGRGAVPATGVGAVVINVTVPNTTARAGYVTVYPSGAARPNASSVNFAPNRVVANELVAKVGASGRISIVTQFGTDVVVDVVGWFPGTTSDPVPGSYAIQAVYAVPSDRAPLAGREAAIAHEVTEVQAWFDGQTGGQHPMFAKDGGQISVVRVQLTQTYAQLSADNNPEVTIEGQIRAALPPAAASSKLAIVLEGRAGSGYCGRTGDMVFIPIENCDIPPSAVSPWPYDMSYLLGHELTHLLGAVPSCAPHHTAGHVNNDVRDVLYSGPMNRDWDHLMLDPGHDDYYLSGIPGCPDIADSPLLGAA